MSQVIVELSSPGDGKWYPIAYKDGVQKTSLGSYSTTSEAFNAVMQEVNCNGWEVARFDFCPPPVEVINRTEVSLGAVIRDRVRRLSEKPAPDSGTDLADYVQELENIIKLCDVHGDDFWSTKHDE